METLKKTSIQTPLDYEKILEHLGELGPWQLFHIGMLWLPLIASGAGGDKTLCLLP